MNDIIIEQKKTISVTTIKAKAVENYAKQKKLSLQVAKSRLIRIAIENLEQK
jgi:ribosomal protein L10